MQIRMLRLLKEKYFVLQLVSVDFAISYCTQNEESYYKTCRLL